MKASLRASQAASSVSRWRYAAALACADSGMRGRGVGSIVHRACGIDPTGWKPCLQRLKDLLARALDRGFLSSHRAWRPSQARRERAAGDRPRECSRRARPGAWQYAQARPGRSGMVKRNETIRSSRSSSRTMMEASMRGSMLPPHSTRPTLRPRNFSGLTSMAARPAAPAPSAMVFCKVRYALTARSRCASSTSTISDTSSRTIGSVRIPRS